MLAQFIVTVWHIVMLAQFINSLAYCNDIKVQLAAVKFKQG